MRIIEVSEPSRLKQIFREIKVDPYGIKIMLPKAQSFLVLTGEISNITANIIKQELLSLGADAAVARDSLTGKTKKTDCLMIGNLTQFQRLCVKLRRQPFGLDRLSYRLDTVLRHYQERVYTVKAGTYTLPLGKKVHLMGIVNMSPDSFSQDGFTCAHGTLVAHVKRLIAEGADSIDIGGESTRPGARPVSVKEEIRRTLPAIRMLARKTKIPLSIDTYKAEVARAALDHGAEMVNDISGLRSAKMRKLVAEKKCPVVIMHMKKTPATMQRDPQYKDIISEIVSYLQDAICRAEDAGINREKIIIDPGIGFGKTLAHNLSILRNLSEFKVLGRPILVGTSRKSFLGKILNKEPHERLYGTIASCVLAAKAGANILRVHDVLATRQALKVSGAILHQN
ncbi:MAG: dihydropteroate synthase [Candidatus Omnitrophica bacterium]|nr:dihydropteroate synthase [Candidatus Omnitrophota bacterium]